MIINRIIIKYLVHCFSKLSDVRNAFFVKVIIVISINFSLMKYHKHSSILAIKEKNVTVYFLYLQKLSKLSLKKDIKDCDRVVLEIYLGYKYQ